MQQPTCKHLKVTRAQDVLNISLNRPDKRNAFFPEMIAEITRTFQATGKDKDLRAVVLKGEGPSFSSGGDLQWMKSMAQFNLKQNLADAQRLFAMFLAIRQCPVPVIGKVHGHAFGGGVGLVAVCDMVGAEASTQFCFSEVKWGLVPSVISPFVIEKVLPVKISEWFTTAKVFLSVEALAGGLINFSAPHAAALDDWEQTMLKHIRAAAPQAVRETKKLQRSYSTIRWKTMQPKVVKLIALRRVSEEGQAGLGAFLTKTNPKWSVPGDAINSPQS